MAKQASRPSDSEGVRIVQRAYSHYRENTLESIRGLITDDFQWDFVGPASIPWAGQYVGAAGMDRFFERVKAAIDVEAFEVDEVTGVDGVVVARGSSRARFKHSGAAYDARWINLFRLREGKICHLTDLYDTGQIVEALLAAPAAPGASR